MRNTGDRLKECRIMKGLSRGEMSEMLNVSTDYLARLETGTQPVTYRIIEKVAELEGWNCDYILLGIEYYLRMLMEWNWMFLIMCVQNIHLQR